MAARAVSWSVRVDDMVWMGMRCGFCQGWAWRLKIAIHGETLLPSVEQGNEAGEATTFCCWTAGR